MDSRQPQTTVRTYNPNVRVANWNEELCLEEDILKDFLAKQDAGTLLIQRSQTLMQTLLAKIELDPSNEKVKFGSKTMIVNPGREGLKPDKDDKQMENLPKKLLSGRNCSSLSLNIDQWPTGGLETLVSDSIGLTGGSNTETSCIRNTFEIVKVDCNDQSSDYDDNILRYGDKFALKSTLHNNLYIFADRIRLGGTSHSKSGITPVEVVPFENSKPSFGAQWIIESFDPLLRMEHEGLPVDKNTPVTIKHCATGQKLAAIEKSTIRTPFGREIELGVQTYFNSHKAEMDNNYWIFK
jgi:hypothetical protein